MKLAADLHIHSCISPCADMSMTPNNVVNMAYLKGLDVIAVADHNSARNLPACKIVADTRGLLFVPAIEAESCEEVHVLCYFSTVEAALEMGDWLYQYIPDIPNVPEIFGEQVALDEFDEPIYTESKLLIQSTIKSIDDIVAKCRELSGVPVPAHINRTSNSILVSLGFIPPQLRFNTVEVYSRLPVSVEATENRHVIYSSDAHRLEDILECGNYMTAFDRSVQGILSYLASEM